MSQIQVDAIFCAWKLMEGERASRGEEMQKNFKGIYLVHKHLKCFISLSMHGN